jgi:hypothetical protein
MIDNIEIISNFRNNKFNIYLMNNEDFNSRNRIKYGYSKYSENNESLINRLHGDDTHHTEYCEYMKIYEFEITNKYSDSKCPKEPDKLFSSVIKKDCIKGLETYMNVELPHMNSFKQHLFNSDKLNARYSHEFMNNTSESINEFDTIMKEEFPKLGLKFIKEFSKEEINNINQSSRNRITEKDKESESFINLLKDQNKPVLHLEHKYATRPYQENIIKNLKDVLSNESMSYLELATGGGKTYIIYRVLKHFMPDTIIIFSPLKKINQQNGNHKYLSILNNQYKVYNYSNDKNFELFKSNCKKENKKMIVIGCSQSYDKIYKLITNNSLTNIFVWFDEAHYVFEKLSGHNNDNMKKFWLEDTQTINKRVFVSASPNKKIVADNSNIFGKLYSPISVRELIDERWLCKINVFMFERKLSKKNACITNFILDDFKKYERHNGFSFHHNRLSAFSIFYEHLLKYNKKETEIKPFLLVGEEFDSTMKNYYRFFEKVIDKSVSELTKLKQLKKKDLIIQIEHSENEILNLLNKKIEDNEEYNKSSLTVDTIVNILISVKKYNSLSLSKSDYSIDTFEKTKKSFGYVVKKYVIGYDFKLLDYIIFSDDKSGFQDIIQCIGRGTRSDQLDTNGKNKDKNLHLSLPLYLDESNMYTNKSINVIKHLLDVYKLHYSDFKLRDKLPEKGDIKYENKEDGNQNITSMLLDKLNLSIYGLKKVIKTCQDENIHDCITYNRYKDQHPLCRLPDNPFHINQFFWEKTYLEGENPYLNKKECKKKIKELSRIIPNYENLSNTKKIKIIREKCDKIPKYDLDKFYGETIDFD